MYGSTLILLHNLAPVSYIYKLNEEHGPVPWCSATVRNAITEEFFTSSKVYDGT
jgi:hypothetical protein